MKRYLLVVISIILTLPIFGKDVSIDHAKTVAITFLQQKSGTRLKNATATELTLVNNILPTIKRAGTSLKSANAEYPEMYFFNINSKGFIIVSGNDAVSPIIAYSDEGNITSGNIPPNVKSWLENYRQQIAYIKEKNIAQTDDIKMQWDGVYTHLKSTQTSVAPLTITKWSQAPFFNSKCPYNEEENKYTYTGCVTTSYAQILKYWEYPSKGMGFYSSERSKYGVSFANFGTSEYDWQAMPDSLADENDAIATLMYQIAVAFDADFSTEVTNIYAGIDSVTHAKFKGRQPELVLKNHFGYSSSIRRLFREKYMDSEWDNICKTELDAGRPINYQALDNYLTGHSWVCDGYDTQGLFHMNWGWGGDWNGYFSLKTMLFPGTSYHLSFYQSATIGIKPADPSEMFKLQLNSDVTANKSTINYGEGFQIQTDIRNSGAKVFNGDICAAIFDDRYILVDTVQVLAGQNINSGEHYPEGISFDTNGLTSLIPGSYRVYILYRIPGENWVALQTDTEQSSTKDYIDIQVVRNKKIRLSSSMNLSTNELFRNDSLAVTLKIANDSIADFKGKLNLSIYNFKGDQVYTVEEKSDVSQAANSETKHSLIFSVPQVDLSPGTYLLELKHQWEGTDYKLTGSTSEYSNPIKISIKETPPEKDSYENNNTTSEISNLNLNWNNYEAIIRTEGSNFHLSTDLDFYSINLEAGYKYSIEARLFDSQNNDAEKSYSADAFFITMVYGQTPSTPIDSSMKTPLEVTGENGVFFVVSSFRNGETGTYLLEIKVTRALISSVEMIESQNCISIFPNPFTDRINVTGNNPILEYQLFDLNGRMLKKEMINDKKYQINLANFNKGIYFLKISSDKGCQTKKIIKQ